MKYRGRVGLAAFCGFFLGLFVGFDLVLFGVIQLDNIAVSVLPIVGLLVGIALAMWAPLGRQRPGRNQPGRQLGSATMALPVETPPDSNAL